MTKNEQEMTERIYRVLSEMLGIDNEKITATFTVDEWANIYASLKLAIDCMPDTEAAKICERIRAKMRKFLIDK